jgi:cell division protease FtsH
VDLCKVVQHKAGQIRNRKSGGSGGSKDSEQGETITFADVAGIDEAKEELEEIVVRYIGPLH